MPRQTLFFILLNVRSNYPCNGNAPANPSDRDIRAGCRPHTANSFFALTSTLASAYQDAPVRAGSNGARLFNGPDSNFLDGHFLRPVQRERALR
jgi:hypothetical protein